MRKNDKAKTKSNSFRLKSPVEWGISRFVKINPPVFLLVCPLLEVFFCAS